MSIDLSKYSSQLSELAQANAQQVQSSQQMSAIQRRRQPVHVMYGGAHLYSPNSVAKISRLAKEFFLSSAEDGSSLKSLLRENWTTDFANDVFNRVSKKLDHCAVEDYRIDFEDGYGARSDADENHHAQTVAQHVVTAAGQGSLPPFIGIRIKPLSVVSTDRSLRTLLLFVESLAKSKTPEFSKLSHLTITLPKVTNAVQVSTLVSILETLENTHGFKAGFFQIEILIESPEAFLTPEGTIQLPSFIAAARGRCSSLHFGVYDFTSTLGIGSAGQDINHVACDFARMWMQVSANLTQGIGLSDGIINVLPLPKHRKIEGHSLTPSQEAENVAAVAEGWRYNYERMLATLNRGFFQGWDLHPSQVAIRHVANHVYVLRELPTALERLKEFLEKSSQANRSGSIFDDRASVLGIISFIQRALDSNIIEETELTANGINLHDLNI